MSMSGREREVGEGEGEGSWRIAHASFRSTRRHAACLSMVIACARDVLEVGDVSSCSPSGLSPFERADSNSVVPSLSDACADSESLCHVARA